MALAAGGILLTYWLSAAAYGPESFARAQSLLGSWIGRLVLFGMTFSLFYHLANGVRHLAWDAGLGLELRTLRASGWLVVLVSVGLTILTFVAAYAAAGRL